MKNDRLNYIESIIKKHFLEDVNFTIIEEKKIPKLISHDNEVPLKTKDVISVLFKINKRNEYFFSLDFQENSYKFYRYDSNKFDNKKHIERIDKLFLLSLNKKDLTIEALFNEDEYFKLLYNYLSNKYYKVEFNYDISFSQKEGILVRQYDIFSKNEDIKFELKRPEELEGYFMYNIFSIFSNSWSENPYYQIFLNYKDNNVVKIRPKYKDLKSENFKDSYDHYGIDKNKNEKILFKHFFDKESFFGYVSEYISLLELNLEIPLSEELYKNPDYLNYNSLIKEERLKRYNSLLLILQEMNIEMPINNDIETLYAIISKNEDILKKIQELYLEISYIKKDLKGILDKEIYLICESNFNKITKLIKINELRYQEQLTLYLKESQKFIGEKINSSILEKINLK